MFFGLIYTFLQAPILTTMRLHVMLYTYWTPLFRPVVQWDENVVSHTFSTYCVFVCNTAKTNATRAGKPTSSLGLQL